MKLSDYLYHEEDGVTLYRGDCMEIMPLFPAGGIDLVLTSPPYNLGASLGKSSRGPRLGHYAEASGMAKRGGHGLWKRPGIANGYGVHDDAMPHEAYTAWQRRVLHECWRLTSDVGAIYYNHKPRIVDGEAVLPTIYGDGLPIRQIVTWSRGSGINFTPVFYVPTSEWIVIFARPDFRLRDRGASVAGDVWHIAPEINTPHPAPFPLKLATTAIETTPARMVFDPFAGSGTTLVAAKLLGRRAIGIEIEERYCAIAKRRLAQGVLPL